MNNTGLKVIAWNFRDARENLVKVIRPWPSMKIPGTAHRNVVQLCALMDNARELLDGIELSLDGADLSGVQFGCMDLHELSFVGSDLSHADLSNCNLKDTRFESARLRDTSLPARSSPQRKGATFAGMKSFESIRPHGERRINTYKAFLRWAESGAEARSGGELPCPAVRQLAHLFGKFVRPNGAARRDRLDYRALERGKQVAGGPGYHTTVEKVLEFQYLEETSSASVKRKVKRPRGPRYGEIVQFMKNTRLSPGISDLLASLCQRPGCQHVS